MQNFANKRLWQKISWQKINRMCSFYTELLVEARNSDGYTYGRPKEVTFYDDYFERDTFNIALDVTCYYTLP